ncbi:CDP-4-dehydro-6-deoxy-D-gulose 4-reductase [Planctomycetales bacterium]|nr:CDP-4-dehydro-6-deoxy-D-gulose 4-reductase [Planctomycetales bacterium]GHT06294.1 CDP-4-dehydro-6-deoxy-D-gulose 4-reductase [Planctomycetales bacterium]
MKKILVTGGTGFVGRNVVPILNKKYEVIAPSRSELNLIDKSSVDDYWRRQNFDILLHLATPRLGQNPSDRQENQFNDMVRAFFNLQACANEFAKVIYTGSGAEYGKTRDITMITEERIGEVIPEDAYGFAKYIMNTVARQSANIYNLRLFGCYGPTDASGKFIRDAIDCCLRNEPIIIRQDCYFDYLYVEDFAQIIEWFIENKPQYHDYNAVTGKPVSLSAIARLVAEKMENSNGIKILKDGWNNEYTATNERLLAEMGKLDLTLLDVGIEQQIIWQKEKF